MNDILKEKIEIIMADPTTKTPVYAFLCTYYDEYIAGDTASEEDEYPDELALELVRRDSGILEAMDLLVSKGYNLDEGDCFNPLMMAVGHADAPMTKFLIDHGANPRYWPDMEENSEWDDSNYYLDDIDIAYFDEHWPRTEKYVNALLQTAKVLSVDGGLGDYGGLCLLVDTEKREISLKSPTYEY